MKFKITMKDPDGVYESVRDAVQNSLPEDLDLDEREARADFKQKKVTNLLCRWFLYDEYLTVEVDTEANTITVLENK